MNWYDLIWISCAILLLLSSYPLNITQNHLVNSTLPIFNLVAQPSITPACKHPKTKKIQEPGKNSQLSESPYFQAFFGIYFCTFDINTTHSTWHEMIGITSLSHFSFFWVTLVCGNISTVMLMFMETYLLLFSSIWYLS